MFTMFTAGPDGTEPPLELPCYPLRVPEDIYAHIRVLSPRQARRRDRRQARARKHATAAWKRRHARRVNVLLGVLVLAIVGVIMRLPDDLLVKQPAPGPVPTTVVTTVTP